MRARNQDLKSSGDFNTCLGEYDETISVAVYAASGGFLRSAVDSASQHQHIQKHACGKAVNRKRSLPPSERHSLPARSC
jgi:hypothetical protein